MSATPFHWYAAHAAVAVVIAFALMIAIEKLRSWRAARDLDAASSVASFVSAAAFLIVKTLAGKALFLALALRIYLNHRVFTLDMWNPLVWIVVFVVRDFVYYWVHRLEHRVRVLWASHMIHHSPETIGATTSIRLPWMEALYKPWFSLWLPLIGFDPLLAVAFDAFAATISLSQHTARRTKTTVLDKVFVTAATHRVHHGSNPEYIDKNFGAVLVIWDRMFGTYEPEVATVVYGIGTKKLATSADVLRGGFPDVWGALRRAGSTRGKVRYLVAGPGS